MDEKNNLNYIEFLKNIIFLKIEIILYLKNVWCKYIVLGVLLNKLNWEIL